MHHFMPAQSGFELHFQCLKSQLKVKVTEVGFGEERRSLKHIRNLYPLSFINLDPSP